MKPEATRLTKAQQCEIITKLSKPNTPSKRVLGWEYEVSEGTIWKVWDNRENIPQKNPAYRDICWNWIVLLTSKLLKLYTTMSSTSTTGCFALMFIQKLNKRMMNCDDCSRRFSETLTSWHWISIVKISCICGKWTCMTCSNNKHMNPIFCQKNLRTESRCILKRKHT